MPPEPPVFLALEARAVPIFRAAAKAAERSQDHPLPIVGWTGGAIYTAKERDGGAHWQGLGIVCWEILVYVCGGDPEIWQRRKPRADVVAKLLEAADLCETRSAPYTAAGKRRDPPLGSRSPDAPTGPVVTHTVLPEPEPDADENRPLSLF